MMGDSDTVVNMNVKRTRQYFVGHNGPYIVNVRSVNKPLESKKIQKFLFEKYKHVHEVKQVNQHKLRIVFQENADNHQQNIQTVAEASGVNVEDISDIEMNDNEKEKIKKRKMCTQAGPSNAGYKKRSAREEANDFPLCKEWNNNYRVYIPEKLVEVRGVISLPVGHDEKELLMEGVGRFRHALMNEVKILEVNRIKRKKDENNLEDTNTVVVTFEGLVLPNVCDYGKLLIPVREYKFKQMFCKKCLSFFHTETMCNNKKISPPENIKCIQCKATDHESGSLQCPKRKEIEKKILQKDRQNRKHTFAEMLKILDPDDNMPNENFENEIFPPLKFPSRKRMAEERRSQAANGEKTDSPQRKKPTRDENLRVPPPGFKNPVIEDDELVESIVDFIKSLLNDLDMPMFIKQLINNHATPYLYKIVRSLTNSVMQKICGASWLATERI